MASTKQFRLHPVAVTAIALILLFAGKKILFPFLRSDSFGFYGSLEELSGNFSLFQFQFYPYLSAVVFLIFVSGFIPPIKRIRDNRRRFSQLIFGTTILFAVLQGYFMMKFIIEMVNLHNFNYSTSTGTLLLRMSEELTMIVGILWYTLGTVLYVMLMQWVTHRGIINGLALFFTVNIIPTLFIPILREFHNAMLYREVAPIPILLMVAAIGYYAVGKKDITVTNGVSEAQVPLHFNLVGLLPYTLLFSLIPLTLRLLQVQLYGNNYMTLFIVAAALAVPTIFFISFNPLETADTLNQFGFSIKGSENSPLTYLKKFYVIALPVNIIVVVLSILIPEVITTEFISSATLFYTMPLLVVVIQFIKGVHSTLDFYQKEREYVPLAEMDTRLEATLLKTVLAEKGIHAVIHSTRFTEVTGTFSFWELSVPRFRSLTIYPEIGGGALDVLVPKDEYKRAESIMTDLFQDEETTEN